MKYLLDINLVLAAIWANHTRHADAFAWLSGKGIVLCPLVEIGFLRISTNPKAINASMQNARKALERFARERSAGWIDDDLDALDSHPGRSEQVTDFYLADLAGKHGLKLATFDTGIKHPCVELVA